MHMRHSTRAQSSDDLNCIESPLGLKDYIPLSIRSVSTTGRNSRTVQ